MSEIKTKIRTYNDVIDLFGEEKAADMLSEALDWSTIDPKNDKKNIKVADSRRNRPAQDRDKPRNITLRYDDDNRDSQ